MIQIIPEVVKAEVWTGSSSPEHCNWENVFIHSFADLMLLKLNPHPGFTEQVQYRPAQSAVSTTDMNINFYCAFVYNWFYRMLCLLSGLRVLNGTLRGRRRRVNTSCVVMTWMNHRCFLTDASHLVSSYLFPTLCLCVCHNVTHILQYQ